MKARTLDFVFSFITNKKYCSNCFHTLGYIVTTLLSVSRGTLILLNYWRHLASYLMATRHQWRNKLKQILCGEKKGKSECNHFKIRLEALSSDVLGDTARFAIPPLHSQQCDLLVIQNVSWFTTGFGFCFHVYFNVHICVDKICRPAWFCLFASSLLIFH